MRPCQPDARHELSTWQATFSRCAQHARAAGRSAAKDVIDDELNPLAYYMSAVDRNRRDMEIVRLVEGIVGDAFAQSVADKITAVPVWKFTRALVVDPLLPGALDRVRREYSKGFYETVDLALLENVGEC